MGIPLSQETAMETHQPVDIAETELGQLEHALTEIGRPRFHARQIFQWIHKRGVTDFASMSDLPRDLRLQLAEHFTLTTPTVVRKEESADGTTKLLLRLADGKRIESVCIPENSDGTTGTLAADRLTFCLSTQVGCAMRCAFCLTGKMGIDRNLTAGEIVGQVRVLCRELDALDRRFTIVLMGMGEPLHNYDETMKALRILADDHGLAVAPRRVTLSTVGVLPALERLATEPLMPNLAISLHSTTEAQRDALVPINRKYGIEELLDACRRFPLKRRERITFEYVMLKDVNDTPDDARRLVRLLVGHQGQGQPAAAQRSGRHSFRAAVRRDGESLREDPGRSRGDGLGPEITRPRHSRRLRPADHGVLAERGTRPPAGDGDVVVFRLKAEGTRSCVGGSEDQRNFDGG